MLNLGEIISVERYKRKITVKQLAAKSGVALNTIFRIENNYNITAPRFDVVSFLLEAMDLELVVIPKSVKRS